MGSSASRKDALVAWLVGLLLAGGLVVGSKVVDSTQHIQNLTRQIQVERYEQTFNACWEVNQRHDATVHALDTLLSQAEKQDPNRAPQIKASKASTLLLINALAPKRKCGSVAATATHQR